MIVIVVTVMISLERITLACGEQYLVHKGPNFAKVNQTVAVDALNMSSQWKVCSQLLLVTAFDNNYNYAIVNQKPLVSYPIHPIVQFLTNLHYSEEVINYDSIVFLTISYNKWLGWGISVVGA